LTVARTKTPPPTIVQAQPISVGRDDAAMMLGIAVSTFEAHSARGTLPRPRMLGGRAVWLVDELRAAVHALPVSALQPPPTPHPSA